MSTKRSEARSLLGCRVRRVTRTVRANVARTLQLAMRGTSLSWTAAAPRPVCSASPRADDGHSLPASTGRGTGAVTSRGRTGGAAHT